MATTDYNRTTGVNMPAANRKTVLAWVIGGVILALIILMLALPDRQERVIDNPQDSTNQGTMTQPLNENTAPVDPTVPRDSMVPGDTTVPRDSTVPGETPVPDTVPPTDQPGVQPESGQETMPPATGGTEDGTRLDEGGTYPQPNQPTEGTETNQPNP